MDRIAEICALLDGEYGRPDAKPRYGPLDEFVLTILSQNTSAANYTRAFDRLQSRFQDWETVRTAPVAEIEDAIRPGGLAKIKAPRIKQALNEILERTGGLSLDFLAEMPDEEAREYLMRFDGVGIKTASCVLMFSLGRPVLPVDTHVHRISRRLGLIGSESAESAHHTLQAMVPDELVYSFHVNVVTHGRRICKAQNPLCDACVLLPICHHGPSLLAGGA